MALTPAEKQKAYRDRKKAEAESEMRKGGDDAAELYRMPFSKFAEEDSNIGEIHQTLFLAGINIPAFDDERDPEEFVIDRFAFGDEPMFGEAKGALGRAEVTIGCLLDAASILASGVNLYKHKEIEARLAELEQATDVDRATAMKEAVRLNKILELLSKQVRINLPQWKITTD